jgi:hypothetical protein
MKYNKLYSAFASLAIASLVFVGCKDVDPGEEHNFDNKLYVSSNPVYSDLLITPEYSSVSREITVRLAMPAEKDINVTFTARPELAAKYDMIYNDTAGALPKENYKLAETTRTIKKGEISTEGLVVDFLNTDQLDNNLRYVLPVEVSSSDIALLESARTVYFVFKGAALINVVANVWGVYFPVVWSAEAREMVTGMETITVEALIRSSNWAANSGMGLSTVFGIEGYFLVRIGDGDRPADQLQLALGGGLGSNWPSPHAVSGLPLNEFVHIAVVYDSTTGERIYYKDGVQVAYDKGNATGRVTLYGRSPDGQHPGVDAYIGYAYNDARFLPGEISEVRIWSVQRTAEQIAKNPYYVDPASEDLVAYWKFNEGTGNVIRDMTGHGTDLTGVAANGKFGDGTPYSATPIWVPVELPAPQK